MKTILRTRFGSHLYGTATPASDEDFKTVFIPGARDILLQRVKDTTATQRAKAEGEKNLAGEHDEERFSVQRYLKHLCDGQTVALDVLFAPPEMWTSPASFAWQMIYENRHRLVSKKSAAFIDYCRTQAAKYGIRGSRVAAARAAQELLRLAQGRYGPAAKLALARDEVEALIGVTEHMQITSIPSNGQSSDHWEVCNRKLPFTASINSALAIMTKVVDEYGHRALAAERNEGVDWKAVSHAVRVGQQAIELFQTGNITFPRPNAAQLIRIKTGQIPYRGVAADIEHLFVAVEDAAERSTLRAEPDHAWAENFVESVHRRAVYEG